MFGKSPLNRTGEPVPKKQSQPALAVLADEGRLRLIGTASAVGHIREFFEHPQSASRNALFEFKQGHLEVEHERTCYER